MAISRTQKVKQQQTQRPPTLILTIVLSFVVVFYFCVFSSSFSSSSYLTPGLSFTSSDTMVVEGEISGWSEKKYLYWGNRVDCPGKHCESCEGLGHQESSLRCALEEAIVLKRVFVMPSRMCINPMHNEKGILHKSNDATSDERSPAIHHSLSSLMSYEFPRCLDYVLRTQQTCVEVSSREVLLMLKSDVRNRQCKWVASSCTMDSLYDLNLISETVPVILDNSKIWYRILSTGMKLGERGIANVEGISQSDLKDSNFYSNAFLINRTASPLSWFMECRGRTNRSSTALPYSFLPLMASKRLRDAADKIKEQLGDYDAIHVRRGDKIKTRKDRFGVARSLHPHLDRDTRPEFIHLRIKKWVSPGRTLFIASNERSPGFFSPLVASYRLAYSSNYSSIIDPVVDNNYQLFMIERLILLGARRFIRTFKEDDNDLSLTDDPKKNTKNWQIPVYTLDDN